MEEEFKKLLKNESGTLLPLEDLDNYGKRFLYVLIHLLFMKSWNINVYFTIVCKPFLTDITNKWLFSFINNGNMIFQLSVYSKKCKDVREPNKFKSV